MYKIMYQCECGKLYSAKFIGKHKSELELCKKCGERFSSTYIMYLEEVKVYRKYWWNKWKVVEVE